MKGRIGGKGTISGRIGERNDIGGYIRQATIKPLPYYEGTYEVEPVWEDITLETKQKSMNDNVKVTEIPYLEAENPQGGITVVIGGQ